jgi:hypothetical protein
MSEIRYRTFKRAPRLRSLYVFFFVSRSTDTDDQTRSTTTLEVLEEVITLHSAKTNSTINGTTTMILEFPKPPKKVFNPEQHISYSTVVEPFARSVVTPVKRPNKLQELFLPN